MNRLVIVPDPLMEAAGQTLKARLVTVAAEINANNIVHVMGPLAHRGITRIASLFPESELMLWSPEGKDHAVAWTSDTTGGALEGHARASAGEGLIARVFESHRSASEAGEKLQSADWTNLDRLRGASVDAMAASPVIVFETCVAVLCRVHYAGSGSAEISPPAEAAATLARLIEDRLIRLNLGLEST